ncbi:hypothetical protein [Kocuria sp. WRN011]|uniref:hypothetical protein n=1 Tax=Kocuria sp. WRN011 TaxID=2029858 RepID=UPI00117A39ED|nr:hypothetical protein [Kocuria sp. WRN011]
MESLAAILVAFFGSSVVATIVGALVAWRSSLKGESQFNSWNKQIREIIYLERQATDEEVRSSNIAKGWLVAAQAETIANISKRIVRSQPFTEAMFLILGSASIVGGLFALAMSDGGDSWGMIAVFWLVGALLIVLFAITDLTISKARDQITSALYDSVYHRDISEVDYTEDEQSFNGLELGKFRSQLLGPGVANNANRLIHELRNKNLREETENPANHS